jgi:glycosyltransferase involved in cell wall biosynthesis
MHERFGSDFEIIAVINGSTDKSVEFTDNSVGLTVDARVVTPQIRVIHIGERVGKGGAVLEGFRHANGDYVAFADADGATAPESLLELFANLEHYDIVIGSRRLKSSIIIQRQPFLRRVFGWGFCNTVRVLFRLPFKDTQCGAKAFRGDAARCLAQVVIQNRWTFDLDLLLSAQRLGFRIYEYPIVWTDKKGGSQLRYASMIFEVLQALWTMKLQARAAARAIRAAVKRDRTGE